MAMLVSNSEAECYNLCERKYYYSFSLGLQPVEQKEAISYGTCGHRVIQEYYRAKMVGLPHRECIVAGMDFITDLMANNQDEYASKVRSMVTKRFLQYAEHFENDPWRVIDVEGIYTVPLYNGTDYVLTLDLLVEVLSGPFKGEQLVIDHKWVYNFMADDEMRMLPQPPKYIWALRKLGGNVNRALINQIRWRQITDDTPDKIFRRKWYDKPQVFLDNVMKEQIKAANDIRTFKEDPIDVQRATAKRNMSRMSCRDCAFKGPCAEELEEKDPTMTLRTMFKPNTSYGYSEEKIDRLRRL